MRFGWITLGCALLVTASPASVAADCGDANPAAVQLANEGDRLRSVDLEGAIAKYEEARNLAPADHRILWKLALACQKAERWDCVEKIAGLAIVVRPKRADYVLLRGVALARQSAKGPADWGSARAVLEEAVTLDPNLGDAHFELAEVALRLGDEKAALVHYTKAAESTPERAAPYATLADLYVRLGFDAHAERTLVAAETRVTDEAKKFAIYSLHGDLLDRRRDFAGALTQYERAKKSCGACNENGQQVAFFNLGAAYAMVSPPRKSEAVANLVAFEKAICKGAAARRYADACTQSAQLIRKLGGP